MRNNDLEFEYRERKDGYIYVNEDLLEEEILKHLQSHSQVDALKVSEEISRDAYLSLTPKRENIIRWYPFETTASILEIGAGYGELTQYLCQNLQKVTAYERKEERLAIIQKRCEGMSNLNCISGALDSLNFEQKYDYILLHDIFAFSRKFFKGKNPNVEMLLFLRQFLTENGKLLLITENRIGLKYFAGAAEDYTQQFFWGLNSFEQDERNRTFSRGELKEILEESGFTNINWFYPYPNAVIPLEIFSEQIQDKIVYGLSYPDYEYCSDRYQLFDEQRMFYTLHQEGIVYQFANAFFVECGIRHQACDIAYVNLKDNYSIIKDQQNGILKYEDMVLPEGIRLDAYLNKLVIKIVNCNLGKDNPFVIQIYDIIKQLGTYLSQIIYNLEDFYICNGKINPIQMKRTDRHGLEYHKWKVIYQWYFQHIMFYRNAYRRISLEVLLEILKVDNIQAEQYLEWFKEEHKDYYYMPRLSQMMFDFEAGDGKDAFIFEMNRLDEVSLAEKLRKLHSNLLTEDK